MTTLALARHPWETAEYARIVSARFEDGTLVVSFADGEEIRMPIDRFENLYIRAQAPNWPDVRAGAHEVLVPSADGDLGIPWDALRALSDPKFEERWTEMGREVSAAIGSGIRQLRVARRLTLPELARRAGVPDDTIERLEAGERPADLDLASKTLQPMDCTLDDLKDYR